MESKLKFSFIVPVYNCAAFLARCLDSLIPVCSIGAEIIIIDDGSTDSSDAIEEKYAAEYPYISVVRQSRKGPSAARNRGIDSARGEYICFADSDDYIDPAAFVKTAEFLERMDMDIWCSDFHRVAANGIILDRVYQIESAEFPQTGKQAAHHYVNSGDCVWNVWRCIFKKEFLVSNRLRFIEGYNCGEDLEFMVRAFMATDRIAFYHNPYYSYVVNYGETLTRVYTAERVRHLMTMLRKAYDTLSASENDMTDGLRKMLSREYILTMSLLYECPENQRKEALRYIGEAGMCAEYSAGVHRLVREASRLFGIPAVSFTLLEMKKLKRILRKIKQSGVRNAAKSDSNNSGI